MHPYICIHKYCLQSFLAETKHFVKKSILYLTCVEVGKAIKYNKSAIV